jgi:glycosyltransferase involved in cell wall biosynthesis
MPRVSILMPARDAAATLPACLRSIARQTEADFECVVVDDGSTDATAQIVSDAARRDRRFVLLQQPRLGITRALQRGLAQCAAAFVARMDADDWMHRDRLRAQLHALELDPTLTGVGCHARAFPDTAVGNGTRNYMTWLRSIQSERDVMRERFVESPLLHPTWMLRADSLRAIGYRDEPWAEDYALLLRLLQSGARIAVVNQRLHAWRRSASCATAWDPRYSEDNRARLKAQMLCEGPLKDRARYLLWGHGDTGKRLRRALSEKGRDPIAIVELDPRKIGQRCYGVDVIAPRDVLAFAGHPILVSVAHAGPRNAARERLAELSLVELRDFYCCA